MCVVVVAVGVVVVVGPQTIVVDVFAILGSCG